MIDIYMKSGIIHKNIYCKDIDTDGQTIYQFLEEKMPSFKNEQNWYDFRENSKNGPIIIILLNQVEAVKVIEINKADYIKPPFD